MNISSDIVQEIFETCQAGFLVIDENQNIIDINIHGAEMFEYIPEEMTGTALADYVSNHPAQDGSLREFSECIGALGERRSKVYGLAKSGRHIQLSIKLHKLPNNCAYAMFYDPTEFACGDTLTNTLSRDQFFIAVRKLRGDYQLLFIDLNKFKEVNDNLGHIAGDFVLKTAAKRIRNVLRDTDLFCRYGGDEFVIVIPGSKPEVAEIVKAKIQKLIQAPINIRGENVSISCSIGVATSAEAITIDDLIHVADQRMYEEKT